MQDEGDDVLFIDNGDTAQCLNGDWLRSQLQCSDLSSVTSAEFVVDSDEMTVESIGTLLPALLESDSFSMCLAN